jgi:nucleoside-diphosphate-sugar epimerase
MATVVIDRAGFIGRRLIPILAKQGEEVVYMDTNPSVRGQPINPMGTICVGRSGFSPAP